MSKFSGLYFCFAALALSACGPNERLTLKGLDISTSEVQARTYVNLEAIVVMGNLRFPNISVPVTNPNTLQTLGQISLEQLQDGSNRMTVNIDYEQATGLDSGLGRTLPNGREIPISLGVGNSALIGIRALEQSRVYIGGSLKKDLFMGLAVAIPAFDNVMHDVPIPLNIFYTYPFSSNITGIAGLFTGPQAGQNGVAVFGKRTNGVTYEIGAEFEMESPESKTSQAVVASEGDNELHKLNKVTAFRLDRLFKKRAVVRIK